MKFKKILAVVLAVLMVALCFSACGKEKEQSDMEYVKEKGKLIVGITDFAPMDYQDENGNWIGFDADMAKAFAEYLGVDIEFVEIVWDNKVFEIDSKTIDCVWNGMTLNDEVTSAMSCTEPYCNNAQVVVVPVEEADKYTTVEACKELQFAVEASSAGKAQAEVNGFYFTEVKDQATTLAEVSAGTSDAAIIDSLMAGAMIGEGTGYDNLTYTLALNEEKYGVGFRKGSDLTAELNKFFEETRANGEMEKIAKQYGVQEALIK